MDTDGKLTPESLNEPPMRGERGKFVKGHRRILPSADPKPRVIRTWNARKIMEEYGFDPIHFLIRVATEGKIPGTNQKVNVEERIKAAKELVKYGHPALSATAITGNDGAPIQIATLDMAALMSSSDAVAAAQTLSLALTAQYREKHRLNLEPGNLDDDFNAELQQ